MKRLWFVCLVAVLACKQKEKAPAITPVPAEMIVAVKPQVALRDGHDIKSRILRQISYGEKVRILPDSGFKGSDVELLGLTGRWLRAEYQNTQGWIFAPLLRRSDETHSIVIINGNANIDDHSVQLFGLNADIAREAARAPVEIKLAYEQGTMNCEGRVVLGAGGKMSADKDGDVRCGGASGDAVYRFSSWQAFKGRLYLNGVNKGVGVCHSEKCNDKDMGYTENVAKALAVSAKSANGIYQGQLVDDNH